MTAVLSRGTSPYFNNFQNSGEQQLLENLIIESIKIYGHNTLYIPRVITSKDELYTEDDQSEYNKAHPIEMYIKSVDGFEGDGIFLSKFGLEIRDQVTFTVAKRIFEEEIDQTRPNEGDVIYFPMNQRLFQVKFVNYKPFFYQLGALQTYELVCELFEYSSEKFNTGLAYIDNIQKNNSLDIFDYAILTEDGFLMTTEDDDYIVSEKYNLKEINPASDNDTISEEAQSGTETDQPYSGNNSIHDWTHVNPFSEGKYSVAFWCLLNSSVIYKFMESGLWKSMGLFTSGMI